jgi:hypothetical protein
MCVELFPVKINFIPFEMISSLLTSDFLDVGTPGSMFPEIHSSSGCRTTGRLRFGDETSLNF